MERYSQTSSEACSIFSQMVELIHHEAPLSDICINWEFILFFLVTLDRISGFFTLLLPETYL